MQHLKRNILITLLLSGGLFLLLQIGQYEGYSSSSSSSSYSSALWTGEVKAHNNSAERTLDHTKELQQKQQQGQGEQEELYEQGLKQHQHELEHQQQRQKQQQIEQQQQIQQQQQIAQNQQQKQQQEQLKEQELELQQQQYDYQLLEQQQKQNQLQVEQQQEQQREQQPPLTPRTRINTSDDGSISFFQHYSEEDIKEDEKARNNARIVIQCADGRTYNSNLIIAGRPAHGGLEMRCSRLVKDVYCREGLHNNSDVLAELVSVYPLFNVTTITMNDIKMARLFIQFDAKKSEWPNYNNITMAGPLKIAFFILVYKEMVKVVRLINYLNHPNHKIYIHVDKASAKLYQDLLLYTKDMPNVQVVSIFQCNHGGISLVYAEVAAYLDLMLDDFAWDYVINLSESDYSFLPIEDLRNLVVNLNGSSALPYWGDNDNLVSRVMYYHMECWSSYVRVWEGGVFNHLDTFWRLDHTPTVRMWLKGHQWHVLRRDFVLYLVNQQLSRDLLFFYKNTKIPDESYSAVLGSHIRENEEKFGIKVTHMITHYTRWEVDPGYKITCDHINTLAKMEQKYFFYRKFYFKEDLDCADNVRKTLIKT